MADLGPDFISITSIGEGSYANVYRAQHKEYGYVRAIKVTKQGIDKKILQKFYDECKLLLKIGNGGHPNIVKIYHPQLLEDRAIVEMDYVEGFTLHKFIRRLGFVPIEEVWRFVHDIVGALAYCHVDIYRYLVNPDEDGDKILNDKENGLKYIAKPGMEDFLINKYSVGHNDLHSGNIMRKDLDGSYILLDFGLAIQQDKPVNPTAMREGPGNIQYRAPETFDWGKSGRVIKSSESKCADVYSIGILLFQLLTGQVPFSEKEYGTNVIEQMHKSSNKDLNIFERREKAYKAKYPDGQYTQDYPTELEAIIKKCLDASPDKRYKNAKELLVALNEVKGRDKVDLRDMYRRIETRNIELERQQADLDERIQELEKDLRSCKKEVKLYETKSIATDSINKDLMIKINSHKEEIEQKDKKIEKERKHKQMWRILAFISLIIMCGTCGTLLLYMTKVGPSEDPVPSPPIQEISSESNTTYIDNPIEDVVEPELPGYIPPKQPESPASKMQSSEFRNMTFSGNLQNGIPSGFGTMTFKQPCRIDNHDEQERVAEIGDYIEGQWENGHLIMGHWYGKDKIEKEFIRIGHIEGGYESDYPLYKK